MIKSHKSHLNIIKAKDIQIFLGITSHTSFLIYKDIKREFKIKRVCNYHLHKYLKIPINS